MRKILAFSKYYRSLTNYNKKYKRACVKLTKFFSKLAKIKTKKANGFVKKSLLHPLHTLREKGLQIF